MAKSKLKLVFICGCLEPGRDGVGDYTRRLAGEIIRLGHNAAILSLNDHFCISPEFGTQKEGDMAIEVYRLPMVLAQKERFKLADKWVQKLNPDWLSLQFVVYSFHSKGLPFFLGKKLEYLGRGRSWHIMFHEIWVGLADDEHYKLRFLGFIQRKLIKNLIAKLNPKVIHTQTEIYKRELQHLGINSQLLSLPSNIPLINIISEKTVKTDTISLIIFGSIYPNAPFLEFAQDIATYCAKTGQKATLTMIGRNGMEQEKWVAAFKSVGIPVIVMGEQSTETISKTLQESTIGIITTPFYVLEKSGSAAALRSHGLPIINVAESWRPKRYFELTAPVDVLVYKPGNFSEFRNLKNGSSTANSIVGVGEIFLRSLSD